LDSFAIQRQPMGKPVGTPRGGLHRDGAVAALLRLSFRARYGAVVRRFSRLHRAVTLASVFSLLAMQPVAAAGNLTLPFNVPQPRITSWTDHHYPDRQDDGTMIRFDGARGYAYDGHRGTDFAVPSNTPVLAADDGTVIYSEWSDSGGWGVVIDHAYDRTAYFHNNQLFTYPGQHVSRGQLIALSGSTGNSTGPHIHFEVRDLLTPWHSVDPYGWTGPGKDPWRWDLGYLWTSNPPVPFLLPLAFPSGAHWNYWYGIDGPPPPVSWRLRDGGRGLAGFAARWDADPGVAAGRTLATSGSAAVPGPGAHTLHLRVFDRAGTSADITYLYLYDVDPPTSALRVDPGSSIAPSLHWSGNDALSGVKGLAIEVAAGSTAFRPWYSQSADQPAAGKSQGALRFLGDPGVTYQLRLTLNDAARNPAAPVVVTASLSAGAAMPATAADHAVLGPLPAQPEGAAAVMGVRQEHPSAEGALLLGTDASVHGLGGSAPIPNAPPASVAAAGRWHHLEQLRVGRTPVCRQVARPPAGYERWQHPRGGCRRRHRRGILLRGGRESGWRLRLAFARHDAGGCGGVPWITRRPRARQRWRRSRLWYRRPRAGGHRIRLDVAGETAGHRSRRHAAGAGRHHDGRQR